MRRKLRVRARQRGELRALAEVLALQLLRLHHVVPALQLFGGAADAGTDATRTRAAPRRALDGTEGRRTQRVGGIGSCLRRAAPRRGAGGAPARATAARTGPAPCMQKCASPTFATHKTLKVHTTTQRVGDELQEPRANAAAYAAAADTWIASEHIASVLQAHGTLCSTAYTAAHCI